MASLHNLHRHVLPGRKAKAYHQHEYEGPVDEIDKGLEGEVASRIVSWAHITRADLRRMTGIPGTTFNRSPSQSERLVRFMRVLDKAVDLSEGDKAAAQVWLNEPSRALGWKKPTDLLTSASGAREVMKLITRLGHGVYS